jgi:MarR family 2-MHQ and catechol resistance regulon transcriptional repressor
MTPDTSGVHVRLILWKAERAMEAVDLRSIEKLGLGLSDFAVLEMLLHKGPQPVNTIGAKVLLTSGSITAAVDRLKARGLVRRGNDPNDRRARIVHLTRAGRKLIACAFAEHSRTMEEAVGVLSSTERVTLVRLLKKLGKSLD